jgi:hypothetical protein
MDQAAQAICDLFEVLDRRGQHLAVGDETARATLDEEVGRAVRSLARQVRRPMRTTMPEAPPRAVGVAMAQAVFSAPHVARTLAVDTTLSDHHGFQPTAHLADALGLPLWELEEIRDDIDRRVASFLKQTRALNWLWFRFDNPSIHPRPLYNTLFPGSTGPEPERFVRRGGRLYVVLPQSDPPPLESLYLRWISPRGRWTVTPDDYFSSRYVDESVRRGIARGIGADTEETERILDNMICAVPTGESRAFIVRDRWRNEGWAELSGLGMAEPSPAWLTWAMPPEAVDVKSWLTVSEQGLAVTGPRRVFDRHAVMRITAMMHGLYAELCARVLSGEPIDPLQQAPLFDLGPYIQRALQPMLDWAASVETHVHLANELGVDPAHIRQALHQVRDIWLKSARTSWGGVPAEGRPHTVQSILTTHLVVAQQMLHHFYRMPPDPRGPHHRVVVLFFAHYAQQAALGRLWKAEEGELPPAEDVLGEWFWGTWQRVLRALDRDASAGLG